VICSGWAGASKEIYFAVSLAEDKALHEADAAYPTNQNDNAEQEDQSQRNVMPNAKMNSELTEKYHSMVQRHYRLTEKQFDDINVEGMLKHWPTSDETKD